MIVWIWQVQSAQTRATVGVVVNDIGWWRSTAYILYIIHWNSWLSLSILFIVFYSLHKSFHFFCLLACFADCHTLCSRNIYWYFMLNNKQKNMRHDDFVGKFPFILFDYEEEWEVKVMEHNLEQFFFCYLVTFTKRGILYLFKQKFNSSNACLNLLICWKNLLKSINNVYENRFSFFCIRLERLCCLPQKI